MLITDCHVFAETLAIAWKRTSFQSGTLRHAMYFDMVSSPTRSSTLLFTPLFTATSSTMSLTMAFASGSANAHICERTMAKPSLFLSHTSCTSLMTWLLCSFINSTFSGVSKSSFSLISFRFGETFLLSALCEFPLFGGVMATDDDGLFVSVVGISKRREARGRLLAWLSFSSSTEMLLGSTMFSKSLSCEMNSELSKEERWSKVVINPNEEQTISVAFEDFLLE